MKRVFILFVLVFSLLPASQVYGQLEGVTRQRSCVVCKKERPTTEFSGKSTTCKACAQKAAAEKERKEQQAAERKRQQQLEQERVEREQEQKRQREEAERKARENAEKERIAREKAEILRKANQMKDLEYNFNMGLVDPNASEQFKCYSKAAELGDARAQTNLGILYEQGHAVKTNYSEAIKWFKKAANQGYAKAQNCLGVMYQHGLGVNKNDSEAFKWFGLAAEQGNPYGQYNLARMYQYKDEMRNLNMARKLYEKAAAQGHPEAKKCVENVYSYVDLGLPSGTLWATCNLGADSPTSRGYWYRWGETEYCKPPYNSKPYKAKEKYNENGKTELDNEDDAAYVNWGEGWCMPTFDQIMELKKQCKWEYSMLPGGYKVIGKNGNSIFLPDTDADYWTRSKHKKTSHYAYALRLKWLFQKSSYQDEKSQWWERLGQIRPVRIKK